MRIFPTTTFLALFAIAASVPALPQIVSADTFRGKVKLRGVLVSRGQFTDISANLTGPLLVASSGDEIRMNGGGLYTRNSADPVGKYKGRTKTITNRYGKVRRSSKGRTISVSRRSIVFPDGRIRLTRPINVTGAGRYRLRGSGTFRVRA